MKYRYKVYHWVNADDRRDLTEHLVLPIFMEDHLDETMDTGEIMLDEMPISIRAPFPPKTKFRIECWATDPAKGELLIDKWDFIVDHDDVEEYVGAPEFCCHRIHLIEASAIAQGMHVDNIALTYELADVNMNYKTTINTEKAAVFTQSTAAGSVAAEYKRDSSLGTIW